MSRGMRLSVLGLYKADSGLFSEMVYPSCFTADEQQTTVGNILAECAELECLFADPDTMKTMIGLWSKLNISVWERIFTASQLEYNPIENYNRTELETISDDRTDTPTIRRKGARSIFRPRQSRTRTPGAGLSRYPAALRATYRLEF